MTNKIARLIALVQMTPPQLAVYQAILSKSNIYNLQAKLSIVAIMAITGYKRSTVYEAKAELQAKGLIVTTSKKLWPGHNAINIYRIVIPWRCDPLARPSSLPWWAKQNNKGPRMADPNPKIQKTSSAAQGKGGQTGLENPSIYEEHPKNTPEWREKFLGFAPGGFLAKLLGTKEG